LHNWDEGMTPISPIVGKECSHKPVNL
jgi:hypothetical protein